MTPAADRNRLTTGIVHFGPGAFHRAHQADFIDRLLDEDSRWGIAAVSLRSPGTINALRHQQGLYTLAILDTETSFRTIHAHSRFLAASDSAAIRAQLLDPGVRIVTSTVTEKGYCLRADGSLDFEHPDVAHDLAEPHRPVSLIGWLTLALADRRAERLAPLTPICCDNLTSNGKKLGRAVIAFADQVDPDLARWITGEVRFPDTMVDSITPATDDRLRTLVAAETGIDDAIPVSREAYAQWVIENVLPAGSPDLAGVGVKLASDVAAWEQAKLRILNGAHSTLAYLGLLAGHETVAEAMADSAISSFVSRLIIEDIIPTLHPSPIDLLAYAKETLGRFRNPAIHHRLSQIAWDGSQKLPYRLLDTIMAARASGRSIERLAMPVAAWMLFIERQARASVAIVDPLAKQLVSAAFAANPIHRLLDLKQIFPVDLASDPTFRDAVVEAASQIRSQGTAALGVQHQTA